MTLRRRRRGHVLLGLMMVVAALAALTTVGLAARDRNLSFESRSLRRHQAKWAAESALARARARRARGRPVAVSGRLPPHAVCDAITYSARPIAGRGGWIRAEGRCDRKGRAIVRQVIDVRLNGPGRGRVVDWREGPAPR